MNREQVMESARGVGLIVEPCRDENFIAIRSDKAPKGTHERMRMNADGSLFTVADGYYWQIGTVEDVAKFVRTKQ